MLVELDQTTLAYMTAALEYVCKKIPPAKDSSELRKRIADEMIALARTRKCTMIEFQNAGLEVLKGVDRQSRNEWLGSMRQWLRWPWFKR